MSLKIRLARGGAKKRPFYRIVVAESSMPRDGRFVERVGTYNPMLPKEHDDRLVIKDERIKYWLSKGAQPTDRVHKMLAGVGLMPAFAYRDQPKKSAPGAKRLEREEEAAAAAAAAAETAAEEAAAAEAAAAEAAAAEAAAAEAAEAEAAAAEAPAEEAPVEAAAEEAAAEEAPAEAAAEEAAAEEAPAEEETPAKE